MLEKLFRAGADAFRVNMSHGDHATHAETIASIRALEKKVNRPITILCDLQGRSCAWARSAKAAR
jgi:pyruvate kinase